MEKQLKCVLLLPLQEMALRKVAVLLWSGSDVLASISKFRFREWEITDVERRNWRETSESKVKDKVSKLGLPKSLAKKMIDLVRPIGLEIRRWKKFHEDEYQSLEIGLPGSTKLCWTTVGRIDYRRTAEELVRCEEISVEQRYEIACDYCLEDWIPLLWEELPEEEKRYFYFYNEALRLPEHKIERSGCMVPSGECDLDLQFYWPHILKHTLNGKSLKFEQSHLNKLKRLNDYNQTYLRSSFNQWAFEQSAGNGYKSAAEHFFQKLTHEERKVSLMRSAHALLENLDDEIFTEKDTCDTTYYLLSLMTPEEQMESIKAHPISILLIFLLWPLQDLFLENARLLWTFIPSYHYDELFFRIADIFQESEHCFPKLFQEFFIQSPLDFKKYFVHQDPSIMYRFLSAFIEHEDSESLEVIFRNVEAADRVKLVCHPRILQLFRKEILRKRWRMVEVCLREATLSGVDRKRLEKAFLRHCRLRRENPVFKRLLEFLDDTYPSADKEKKARKRKRCPEE